MVQDRFFRVSPWLSASLERRGFLAEERHLAAGYAGTAEPAPAIRNLMIWSMGNPVAARPIEDVEEVRRKVFCRRYGRCLDEAIARDWPNFSCDSCVCFCPEERSDLNGDATWMGVHRL